MTPMTMQQYWQAVGGPPPAPGSAGSPLTQNVGGYSFGANQNAFNNPDLAFLQSGRTNPNNFGRWYTSGGYQSYLSGLPQPTDTSAMTGALRNLYR